MAIRDYFPKREKMTTLQVKMPEKLVREVQKEMKADNYDSWKEFLTVCFRAYLESRKCDEEETEELEINSGKTKK